MPIFEKNAKAIVHGFSKMSVFSRLRNQTIFGVHVRLYVLKLHTNNFSRSVYGCVENCILVLHLFYESMGL